MLKFTAIGAMAAIAGSAAAQPVIDGTLDAGLYGSILFVQNQPTGFGDNTEPGPDFANGSEIDGIYAVVIGDALYIMVTGNLESNFNKLELFFDVAPGGQSPLRGDNVDVDFNGLNRMGEGECGDPPMLCQGLTFDDGFEPDYWVTVTNGNDPIENYSSAAVLRTDGPLKNPSGFPLDYGAFDGGLKSDFNPIPYAGPRVDIQNGFLTALYCNYGPRLTQIDPLNPIPGLIQVAIDNSNIAGVTGASTAGAADVTTGIELAIDLEELGWDGASPIRIAGFINGSGHDFVSNQVIGGLPAPENLGEPRLIDFSVIDGDQFVTVGDSDCYADCDGSGSLDFFDFLCFQNEFALGSAYADCDGSGSLDFFDFLCYQNAFAAGCP
ncbi:MAG: hypothetical protein ACF8R7_05255 [Phycisphaerales bacterium JB039]